MFQNKLPVIKYYYNFLDLQMCYADRTLGFESLLMVLELLALLHLDSVLIVLLSHIYFKCLFFYRIFIVVLLNWAETLKKIQELTSSPIKAFQFAIRTLRASLHIIFPKSEYLISIHQFDIICLSETYLNFDISSGNENLDIPGYRLVRSNHPSNDNQGGVGVYFKFSLPVQILSISMFHETFVKNFELNLELIFTKNPYLTLVVSDFNFKSQNCYKGNKTAASGTKLEIMASHYGFTQIISEPTLILEDASFCIDLIFTSQPNMVLHIGVHSSLHPISHIRFYFLNLILKSIILHLTEGIYAIIKMKILFKS